MSSVLPFAFVCIRYTAGSAVDCVRGGSWTRESRVKYIDVVCRRVVYAWILNVKACALAQLFSHSLFPKPSTLQRPHRTTSDRHRVLQSHHLTAHNIKAFHYTFKIPKETDHGTTMAMAMNGIRMTVDSLGVQCSGTRCCRRCRIE